jgi:hypothetical protein
MTKECPMRMARRVGAARGDRMNSNQVHQFSQLRLIAPNCGELHLKNCEIVKTTDKFAGWRSQGGVALKANATKTTYLTVIENYILETTRRESRWVKVSQGNDLPMKTAGTENQFVRIGAESQKGRTGRCAHGRHAPGVPFQIMTLQARDLSLF